MYSLMLERYDIIVNSLMAWIAFGFLYEYFKSRREKKRKAQEVKNRKHQRAI